MRADLRSELYRVFSRYSARPSMEACAHCVPPAMPRELTSHPLTQLPPDVLDSYSLKAMSTWGTVDDWRHYLPRIIDIIDGGACDLPGFELHVLAGKLARADWHTWPAAETGVLRQWLAEYWRDLLAQPPTLDRPSPLDFLDMLRDLGEPKAAYLRAWWPTEELPGLLHLAQVILHAPDLRGAHPEILAWLHDADLRSRLEDAYLRCSDSPDADLLAQAADWLGSMRWEG